MELAAESAQTFWIVFNAEFSEISAIIKSFSESSTEIISQDGTSNTK
jgi:hypothetical protein